MLYVWIANAQKTELSLLSASTRRAVARLSDEPLQCETATRVDALKPLLEKGIPDLACLDLELNEGLSFAQRLRSQSREFFLVVVAGAKLSPMQYLHPSVLAGGLLLRPYTPAQAEDVLREAMVFCLRGREQDPDSFFWVETRAGREAVRYSDIRYFEALGKRIALVTGAREYQFSDTMEHLSQTLPPAFVRCHRGFIVRRDRIDRIRFSENVLYLDGGEAIPLSRSYKSDLKGPAR